MADILDAAFRPVLRLPVSVGSSHPCLHPSWRRLCRLSTFLLGLLPCPLSLPACRPRVLIPRLPFLTRVPILPPVRPIATANKTSILQRTQTATTRDDDGRCAYKYLATKGLQPAAAAK